MADLMAGKNFAQRSSFPHEKVKFTVSVRGRQWSSARYVQETVEEFARVIQRNARRLDFIGENDRIQRLQLARADGSEPEELDVDATLEDVIICRGDKHLVAIIISSKFPPLPCNGNLEAEKLGLSSTMALPFQSKSKVRNDSTPNFQIRYGLATSPSVRPLKETASGIPGLKPVPVLFKRRVASIELPQRRLQITIPPSDPNPPAAFQDKRGKLAYDFDSDKESFRPQENLNRFDGAVPCKNNGPVALVSSKSTPSPAELAHFLVKGSSLPSNRSTAVSDTCNPFWTKYIGNATPVAGFHSFASALLRRFPIPPPNTMVCGSSADNVATLAKFLASHIRAVVPGNSDRVGQSRQHCACDKIDNSDAPEDVPSSTTEARETKLEGSGPGERSNFRQSVGNSSDNASVGCSQEKDKRDPSSSPADAIMTSTPTNGCPKSGSIHGRSELIFFVNRRSKTGAGAHHLKLSDLSVYFHLSVVDAAKKLGVSQTTLKKACRKFGLKRWPGRKVRSLESTIHGLEQTIAVGQGAGMEHLTEAYIRSEVTKLQQEMDQLVHGTMAQHSPVTRPGDFCKRLYSRGWRSKYHSPSFDLDLNVGGHDNEHLLSAGKRPGEKADHKGTEGSAVVEQNYNNGKKIGLDEYRFKGSVPDCNWSHKSHLERGKAMKNGSDNTISLDLGVGVITGSCALETQGTQNVVGNLAEKLGKEDTSLGVVELVENGESLHGRSLKRPKLEY